MVALYELKIACVLFVVSVSCFFVIFKKKKRIWILSWPSTKRTSADSDISHLTIQILIEQDPYNWIWMDTSWHLWVVRKSRRPDEIYAFSIGVLALCTITYLQRTCCVFIVRHFRCFHSMLVYVVDVSPGKLCTAFTVFGVGMMHVSH